MIVLKRAGQAIDYEPWQTALEQLGVVNEMGMDLDLWNEVVEECTDWLSDHFDESEDLVIEEPARRLGGIRPVGRTVRIAPVQRQPVTGVVGIRSFLRNS
jgi:hypothetical protein